MSLRDEVDDVIKVFNEKRAEGERVLFQPAIGYQIGTLSLQRRNTDESMTFSVWTPVRKPHVYTELTDSIVLNLKGVTSVDIGPAPFPK